MAYIKFSENGSMEASNLNSSYVDEHGLSIQEEIALRHEVFLNQEMKYLVEIEAAEKAETVEEYDKYMREFDRYTTRAAREAGFLDNLEG